MKKLIIANWKSNKTINQAELWLKTAQELATDIDLQKVTPVLTPSFPHLSVVADKVKGLGWQLGSQDISSLPSGSYTGAVSTQNLKDLGITYVIVGHSERRRYFDETDQLVSQKAEQALELGATPVICVEEDSLESQATALTENVMKNCVVTYEPTSSIGSGNSASLDTVKQFKEKTIKLFGQVPFLYGGSVDETNIGEYMLVTDGSIIGTASLDASQFIKLLQAAQGESPADL